MKAWEIVGYVYRADIYCPVCIVPEVLSNHSDYVLHPDDRAGEIRYREPEGELARIAGRLGIDRDDEHSFDSDVFPKVVLASSAEGCEHCGQCHEPLIGDCECAREIDNLDTEAAIRAAENIGREHGENAAAWWEQDAIGGRASGDVRDAARRVLAGIDDGDPAILDVLPAPDLSGQWADGYTADDLAGDVASEIDAEPDDLDDLRDDLCTAYENAFSAAATDAVAAACRRVTGDDERAALQLVAADVAASLIDRERVTPNGTRDGERSLYVTLADDAAESVQDLIRELHEGVLPDDHIYAWVRDACANLAELTDDDLDDAGHAWADGGVDVSHLPLLDWLSSHAERAAFCDEAARDGLVGPDATIYERIQAGQYAERRELWGRIVASLGELATLSV